VENFVDSLYRNIGLNVKEKEKKRFISITVVPDDWTQICYYSF